MSEKNNGQSGEYRDGSEQDALFPDTMAEQSGAGEDAETLGPKDFSREAADQITTEFERTHSVDPAPPVQPGSENFQG